VRTSARQAEQPAEREHADAEGGDGEGVEPGRESVHGSSGSGRLPAPFDGAVGYPAPVPVLDALTWLDRALLDAVLGLRLGILTPLMALASAWWVKGVAIAAVGGLADLRRRPRAVPWTALLATAALLAASLVASLLKLAVDRARPPQADPGVVALVPLPGDAAFPSGHAATAFAAAGVVALLHPRLRAPALALAALIGLSRLYLGVHYPLDVLAGAALGLAVAWAAVAAARAIAQRRSGRSSVSSSGSSSSSAPMPFIAGPPGPSPGGRPWVASSVSGASGPAPSPSGMSRVNSAGVLRSSAMPVPSRKPPGPTLRDPPGR
jgi:undecaprenyl-diphosphatase